MSAAVCEVCALLWAAMLLCGTSYLVFGLGASAWWYAFAVFLLSGWTCKLHHANPEQDQ